jgi:hypothetical protein
VGAGQTPTGWSCLFLSEVLPPFMGVNQTDKTRQLSKSVQVELNNVHRRALGLSWEDHVAVTDLHEKTN